MTCIGFVGSPDGLRVRCIACSATEPNPEKHWILRSSFKRHLDREEHKRCTRIYAQKEKTRRESERQLEALQEEFLELGHHRTTVFESTSMVRTQPREPEVTEEERQMWDDFEHDRGGANLSAGSDPQVNIDQARDRFSNLCDNLVFLSDVEVAKVVGATDEESISAAEVSQEEQALLDMLDDYGKSTLRLVGLPC